MKVYKSILYTIAKGPWQAGCKLFPIFLADRRYLLMQVALSFEMIKKVR